MIEAGAARYTLRDKHHSKSSRKTLESSVKNFDVEDRLQVLAPILSFDRKSGSWRLEDRDHGASAHPRVGACTHSRFFL